MMRFLSCDWGTSSFRLRIVNLEDATIENEYVNDSGIQSVYNSYLESDGNVNRVHFYFDFLSNEIKKMADSLQVNLEEMLIVCSGMASSSIGIKELPYAGLPMDVMGTSMGLEYFPISKEFNHSLLLLSGVQSADNVMRGEETQLIGVVRQLKDFSGKGIFILPGTHSKHIWVNDNQITGFKTYMTGEVFHLMANKSILSKSVMYDSADNVKYKEVFAEGIKEGANNALLSVLFKTRTNDLFDRYSKEENFHYLSGLLIGNELTNLVEEKNTEIYLCSEGKLHPNYVLGMEILGINPKVLPMQWVKQAVIQGQIQVLNQHINNDKNIFLGSF
ncbi:2-dehydro-3-deoxygalactonokinase [Cyclobacterium amurskyense]|nr:2-dehydro-3-deoxygalactonokinase [Cyclobacterium amurskyense]